MLQTYLNDPALKTAFLEEITKHEEQDQLIKGTYGEMNGMFHGCAIGCALHSLNVLQGREDSDWRTSDHARYEAELGLPTWFAFLEDQIFEHLPDDLSRTWPRRLAEAIPVGAVVDDRVLARILLWSLVDVEYGVRGATDDATVHGYIDAVADMLRAESEDGATADQREAAARAARAARAPDVRHRDDDGPVALRDVRARSGVLRRHVLRQLQQASAGRGVRVDR